MNDEIEMREFEVREVTVEVPDGWTTVDDVPDGLALVALAPPGDGAVRANLVVTMSDRPDGSVDDHLDAVLEQLLGTLDGSELLDAWTMDDLEAVPPVVARRHVVRYRDAGTAVVLAQQLTWIGDALVTVSITTADDTPEDMVEVLVRCLEPTPLAA